MNKLNIKDMGRYLLSLTKAEVNQLYALAEENKKTTKVTLRNKLFDAYVRMNNIIVNGGGA